VEHSIAERLELIEEKIEAACRRSGRKRQEIELMGVTKFQPPELVEEAWKAGLRLFGESRVQEAVKKFSQVWETHPRDGDVKLHFIGSLQRNKAKTAASFFDCIQSVDRDSLIEELGALTTGRERPEKQLQILLEYHTGEDTKAGFPDRDSLYRAAEKVLSFPGLFPAGLMTMAPLITGDETAVRSAFRELVAARDGLLNRFPGADFWSCLSMGMTNDYEIAIEEGSSLIRIGTAIFGERRT
jgi:pyridoxal phosphate enzyme (YggS family)